MENIIARILLFIVVAVGVFLLTFGGWVFVGGIASLYTDYEMVVAVSYGLVHGTIFGLLAAIYSQFKV